MHLTRQRTLRAAIATLFVPLVLAAALPQQAIAKPAATSAAAVKPNAAFD
jgi:hypothetical protein